MPRTAITLAKSHDGKWSLVSGPDVPMLDQIKYFRETRATQSNSKIAALMYQESDGLTQVHNLLSPDEHKKREERRAKELAASEAIGKSTAKAAQDKIDAEQKQRDENHKAEIERIDNLTKTFNEQASAYKKSKEEKSTEKTTTVKTK